jgi:hypothetical protein
MAENFSNKSDEELVRILLSSPIATPISAMAGGAIGEFMRRLGGKLTELNQAIDRLNKASGDLVTETNRLTRRILHLTVVGLILAAVGVGAAIMQTLKP